MPINYSKLKNKDTLFGGTEGVILPQGDTATRDGTPVLGTLRYNTQLGFMEQYNATGWAGIDAPPVVTNQTGVINEDTDSTITISGSNFKSGSVVYVTGAGVNNVERALATSFVSSSELTAATNASSVNYVGAASYGIKVVNPSGLSSALDPAGTVDADPVWTTSAGTIATIVDEYASYTPIATVVASDPNSDAITYSVTSGSIPAGTTFDTNAGTISGNPTNVGSSTTSTFEITATANSVAIPRTFNIIVNPASDGTTQARAAESAQAIYNLDASLQGSGASGWYWIKGTGTTANARKMYCSMNGNGYMLWYSYMDPMSGSMTITDPGTSGTEFTLTSNSTHFMYALPSAIADNVTYIYCNSNLDTNYTTPAFADFKYGITINSEIRSWMTTTKDDANKWGVNSVPVNSVRTVGGTNYRFGTSIGTIQYGHNRGTGNEVDGLSFRNQSGSGGLNWGTTSDIWDKSGWGPIDASTPTNMNSGWGSTGRDESAWGGSNRTDHVYCWCR